MAVSICARARLAVHVSQPGMVCVPPSSGAIPKTCCGPRCCARRTNGQVHCTGGACGTFDTVSTTMSTLQTRGSTLRARPCSSPKGTGSAIRRYAHPLLFGACLHAGFGVVIAILVGSIMNIGGSWQRSLRWCRSSGPVFFLIIFHWPVRGVREFRPECAQLQKFRHSFYPAQSITTRC